MELIPNWLNFPLLIIPIWLLFIVVFAFIKDMFAILGNLPVEETAYDIVAKEVMENKVPLEIDNSK